MKKFFAFLAFLPLFGCASYPQYPDADTLDVSFIQPSDWGRGSWFSVYFPASQLCHAEGGQGKTPALFVSDIPDEANLLLLEINEITNPAYAQNGGLGVIGFYHKENEDTHVLLPVSGEQVTLPEKERLYAFKEKSSRVNSSKAFAYHPPCTHNKTGEFSATVKAVRRTGAFDTQTTEVLAIGTIYLGKNIDNFF